MVVNVNIDIAAITSVIVWSTLVGIMFVILSTYRKNIGSYVKELMKDLRLSKVSVGPSGVSVELAVAKGFEPKWTGTDPLEDIRQTALYNLRDSVSELIAQIQETSTKDYAIFDLGHGSQWLSSRLYLFTIILQRMHGIRSIVFVDRDQEITHHFVGVADPIQVQYSLARRYPWLEKEFAKTYGDLGPQITSIYGSLESHQAIVLIEKFLEKIQKNQEPTSESDWVKASKDPRKPDQKWEHAEWLNTDQVEQILQEILDKSSWVGRLDLQGKSREDQLKLILSFKGHFVAVLNQNHWRFEKLIDRQQLANEVVYNQISK